MRRRVERRCKECGAPVRVLIVMNMGAKDPGREAWECLNPRCMKVEIVEVPHGRPELQDRGEVA